MQWSLRVRFPIIDGNCVMAALWRAVCESAVARYYRYCFPLCFFSVGLSFWAMGPKEFTDFRYRAGYEMTNVTGGLQFQQDMGCCVCTACKRPSLGVYRNRKGSVRKIWIHTFIYLV
jgi:hypothetical protein